MTRYLTIISHERLADFLELHSTANAAEKEASEQLESGATSVQIFECKPVEFEWEHVIKIIRKNDT